MTQTEKMINNTETKLSAIELTKIFPHPSKEDVNIAIFAGASFEMTSKNLNFIIGSSGSGKTTLLRMIMSIEPISAGELFLNDKAIPLMKGKEKNQFLQTIGYMDQLPAKYLSLLLSVEKNLDYSLLLYTSLPREERKKQIKSLASTLGLTKLLDQQTITLSGGEMRRLALACSIIFEPTILICDEPTAQLDVENKSAILSLLEKLNQEVNSLIIVSTHDQSILGSHPTFEIKDRRIHKW